MSPPSHSHSLTLTLSLILSLVLLVVVERSIDSTMGFYDMFFELDYRESALALSSHPLIFDSLGRVCTSDAHALFSFLVKMREKLHGEGRYLMTNGVYTFGSGQFQWQSLFDVAGTETNWLAGPSWPQHYQETGEFKPNTARELLLARSLSGARPYLFLLDTHFNHWPKDYTDQFFQVCLAYGLWPGFFTDSPDNASELYFSQPALYNRDRPIFLQFVPVLKAINRAGWNPVTYATATAPTTVAGSYILERFGALDRQVIYFTLRREGGKATGSAQPVALSVQTTALGLRAGNYSITEIAHNTTLGSDELVVTSAASATIPIADLKHNQTLVVKIAVHTQAAASLESRVRLKTDDVIISPEQRTPHWTMPANAMPNVTLPAAGLRLLGGTQHSTVFAPDHKLCCTTAVPPCDRQAACLGTNSLKRHS